MFRNPWKIQIDDEAVYLVAGRKTYTMTPREAVVIGTELASAGFRLETEIADAAAGIAAEARDA